VSAARITLALFWLAAGTNHFVNPRFYDGIVPPPLDGSAREVTYASGVAELLGGVLVLIPSLSRVTRIYLLLLLLAVYPSNIWMAIEPDRFKASVPQWVLIARLPVQFLFAWHVVVGTRHRGD
jgi:uncharacterized membrane protein